MVAVDNDLSKILLAVQIILHCFETTTMADEEDICGIIAVL